MPWSVVQTYPNAAGSNYLDDCAVVKLPTALRNLRRQCFEFYNPRFMSRTVENGVKLFRRVQLFPDYVFVRAADRWRALKSTRGVAQLLMAADDKPAEVPDEMIDEIRLHENSEGLVVLGSSRFRRGQKVSAVDGAFASSSGVFDGQSSARDRVFVLFSMLGAQRRVEMDEGNLIEA